jgi:hypothetical protein
MADNIKGKKTYHLEICFDDQTDELEYVREYVDGDKKVIYYGTIDITDYFDEEGLSMVNDMYDIGVS